MRFTVKPLMTQLFDLVEKVPRDSVEPPIPASYPARL
jgi:hypothetical protein